MKLLTESEFLLPTMDAARVFFEEQSEEHRPSGLHQSDIIWDMHQTVHGVRHRPSPLIHESKRDLAEKWAYTESGFVWEEMILKPVIRERFVHRRRNGQPGGPAGLGDYLLTGQRYSLDTREGTVLVSPDAIDASDQDGWWLEEYKWTTRSSKKFDEDPLKEFWRWFFQMGGYLKAVSLTRVRLFVNWAVGDWSGSGAHCRCYEIQFTQREIDHYVKTMIEHAKKRGLFEKFAGRRTT